MLEKDKKSGIEVDDAGFYGGGVPLMAFHKLVSGKGEAQIADVCDRLADFCSGGDVAREGP
jgi:hypothetical protein